MRTVFVGDVHAVLGELDECRALIFSVIKFAQQTEAKQVLFLGDQFHSMSAIRAEVLSFWKEAFATIKDAGLEVLALVGNHDFSNNMETHVLIAFPEVTVIDKPALIDGVLYTPFVRDPRDFEAVCQKYPTEVVVCHQAFEGVRYESGMYVGKEGVNPDAIPQKRVITGHIHKPGRYGKVWNVGSPRWRIASDANEDRAVWALDPTDDTASTVSFDTANCCKRIVQLEDTPESPAVIPAPGPARTSVRIDVRGPAAYVVPRAAELQAAGARVRVFRTDAATPRVREAEGLGPAWTRFVAAFRPRGGTGAARVAAIAAEAYGLAA